MARRDSVVIRGERRGRPGRWLVHYYHTAGPERTWKTFKRKEEAEAFRLEVLNTRALDPSGEVDYTTTIGGYAKDAWLP